MQSNILINNSYRDLSLIGRELSKIVFIDNLPENFRLQENNGLFIKTWTDEIRDNQLYDFLKLLKGKYKFIIIIEIYYYDTKDVRNIIKNIKKEVGKRLIKNPHTQNPYADLSLNYIMSHSNTEDDY